MRKGYLQEDDEVGGLEVVVPILTQSQESVCV